jgi:hypothetical protein
MLTVTFTGEAEETLAALMRRTGRSATDLLAEALAFERKAVEAEQAGGRLLVERGGRRYALAVDRPAPRPPSGRARLLRFPRQGRG